MKSFKRQRNLEVESRTNEEADPTEDAMLDVDNFPPDLGCGNVNDLNGGGLDDSPVLGKFI